MVEALRHVGSATAPAELVTPKWAQDGWDHVDGPGCFLHTGFAVTGPAVLVGERV